MAAPKLALPGWFAVIEQVPTATSVTITPETVQTAVLLEVNITASPELAVALSEKGELARI